MKITIPLTGTVLVEGSVWNKGDLVGDNNDPIRPIELNLGNISWVMVDVDLENEVMVIEAKPATTISEPDLDEQGKPKMAEGVALDEDGNERKDAEDNPIYELQPVYKTRPATEEEKIGFLQHARDLIEGHTKDELYQISKCSRLKRPFKKAHQDLVGNSGI